METLEKQTEAQEAEILSENREKRNKILDGTERLSEQLQTAMKAWYSLGLKTGMVPSFLWNKMLEGRIEEHTEAFLRGLMLEENEELKKLPVPKSTALQFIELPAGTGEFIHALKKLYRFKDWVREHIHKPAPIEFFLYNEETEQIEMSPSFDSWLNKQTRRYASAREVEFIAKVRELADQMNNLELAYPGTTLIDGKDAILYTSSKTGKISIDLSSIRLLEEEEAAQ